MPYKKYPLKLFIQFGTDQPYWLTAYIGSFLFTKKQKILSEVQGCKRQIIFSYVKFGFCLCHVQELFRTYRFIVSRRHRQLSPGASPYVVLMETIKINPTNAEMQLVNTETNVRLLLSVYALKDNMARLKINELEPIRTRYEIPVGDVLVGEPKEQE